MFKKKNNEDLALVSEIKLTISRLARANDAASQCSDALLLESTMYEIKYLQTRYAYLTRLARARGISSSKYFSVKNGGRKK